MKTDNHQRHSARISGCAFGRRFICAAALAIVPAGYAAQNVTIQNTTYPTGHTEKEAATSTITATTAVTVKSGANVSYVAGTKITLGDGFKASSGATFRASIDADGDGMPDGWEAANQLDPQSASGANGAAGNPDGDGLNNLAEFLLGTNPNATTTTSGSISAKIHRPPE
jgi:hypothetical protein